MDATRLPILGGKAVYYEGETAEKVDLRAIRSTLPDASTLSRDLDRFDHFSDGYLSWHPSSENVIGDARYALLPQSNVPLWGIEIDLEEPDAPARFVNFRTVDEQDRTKLWTMIRGAPLSN